jgi:hypothetical protein
MWNLASTWPFTSYTVSGATRWAPPRDVTPSFKIKTRCSSYVCPGSSCHTYDQNVNTENQCLCYINFTTRLLSLQRRLKWLSCRAATETRTPQAINRGQCKPLEEIFIEVVHLISIFWATLQQGWVDLWLLLSKWSGKHSNIYANSKQN